MNASIAVPMPAHRPALRRVLAAVALAGAALVLSGCGGGVEVVIDDPPPPPPASLGIHLTRVAYEGVQVDWSDDPYAYQFTVERNGATLANVMSTTLVDYSVVTNVQYCYRVFGYSHDGELVSLSDSACIVLAP